MGEIAPEEPRPRKTIEGRRGRAYEKHPMATGDSSILKPRRVLIVDDEKPIVDVIEYILKENGFETIAAFDGNSGLAKFKQAAPDLVVLDLNLPGISGLDLFREMRRLRPDAAIIMLTTRSDEIDRVVGLELGADDYVTKPFSARELAARVKTILRRAAGAAVEPARQKISHGPLALDCDAFSITYFGRPVTLTRSEFKLVECLVRHPAQVFSRDSLMDRIYDDNHIVAERSIDAYIKRLRKKFADAHPGADPIETVHGLGYKLNSKIGHDE